MDDFWRRFPADRLIPELSLWSADLPRLADEFARMDPYAGMYHFDVADGHFVPEMLFFPDLVAQLRPLTEKPFHVHLMTDNPLAWIGPFADAGADLITVHHENDDVREALAAIHAAGVVAGLAIQLETPVEAAGPFFDEVAIITLMGTRLGIKGVGLDESAPGRIRALQTVLRERGLTGRIRVAADGGIREHTVPMLRAAGADTVVMGSLAFKAPDLAGRFAWLAGLPAPENG
jgi:ribulose-phosphate 3-epimerase